MGLGLEPSGPCSITHLTSSLGGRELLSGSQLARKRTPGDLHTDRHKSQGTEPMQTLALANPDTAQPREGPRGTENAHNPLVHLAHTTHALTWSLSHTHSRTHTQAPPTLFLQEQGEREGGPGRPRAGSDPSPAPPRQTSQSERGGGGGGGRHPGSRPSFPVFSQARRTSFPHLPPLRTKLFPLSPPRQLPAARISGRTRSFPAPSPGRGRGGCTPGDESRARPGSCPGAGGEGGEKALAGSPSAESLVRRLLLAFPGPAAEEPWDQGSAL